MPGGISKLIGPILAVVTGDPVGHTKVVFVDVAELGIEVPGEEFVCGMNRLSSSEYSVNEMDDLVNQLSLLPN